MSLAKNIDLLRHLPKLSGLRFAGLGAAAGSSPLQEVTGVDFRMVIYSSLLIVLMLTRPQGLFGSREIWQSRKKAAS